MIGRVGTRYPTRGSSGRVGCGLGRGLHPCTEPEEDAGEEAWACAVDGNNPAPNQKKLLERRRGRGRWSVTLHRTRGRCWRGGVGVRGGL